MTERTIEPLQIHTCGKSDFDFAGETNCILSVSDECLLKKINYRTREVIQTEDLQDPTYAIAVNPDNKNLFYIGGHTTKVELINNMNLTQGFPIMAFSTEVHRIVISQDKSYVGACSVESGIVVYNVQENSAYRPKPQHDSSCIYVGFNSTAKYVASTACDGTVNIYSLSKMEENPLDCKVKTHKIGKETKLEDDPQILRFDWHPTNNILALPGNLTLQLLRENSDGSWAYSIDSGIKHSKDIAAVCWNDEGNRMLTFSIDKEFRLWNYHNKELLQYCNYQGSLLNIKYNPVEKVFGFVDNNGFFGYWAENEKGDDIKKESVATYVKKPSIKKVQVESEYDEDDLKELDRLMDEEYSHNNKQLQEVPEDQEDLKIEPEDEDEDDYNFPADDDEKIKKKEKNDKQEETSVSKEIPFAGLSMDDQPEKKFDIDMFEKEKKKKETKHNVYLDFPPQPILYPSSTVMNKNRRFLSWNLVGNISIRNEIDYSAVDIEFSNKAFHSGILLRDNYGISMATMNEKGVILANRAEQVDEDQYENEFKDENRKFSHIIFRPLNYQVEEKKEWIHTLPEGESVDAVAIGNKWCAAITDLHLIRIFNHKGVEGKPLCLDRPLVCAAGYENLLAIVYHNCAPFLDCQCLKLKVIDIETDRIIYNDVCPISPNTTMTWFGFSDSGMIVTQDSSGAIRGLSGFQQWYPLHLASDNKKHTKFWMIGVHDYNFIGVLLEKDDLEPSVYSRPPVKSMKIRFPFINEENYYVKKNTDILKKQIVLDHEKFRNQNWLEYKLIREKNDNMFYYSENILDKREIQGAEDNIEKSIVDLFQDCLLNDDQEKALILASSLKSIKSLKVCLFLCSKNNLSNLAQKVQAYIDGRNMLVGIEKVSTEIKSSGNEIVIMKGSQVDPILESRNKNKKGLSAHAIQLPNQKPKLLHQNSDEISPEKLSDHKPLKVANREDALDGIFHSIQSGDNLQDIKENKNFMNLNKETPTKITPTRELFAKKKTIFEEFSDKNMGSNKTSQNNSQLRRKQDNDLPRDNLKKVKEGTRA